MASKTTPDGIKLESRHVDKRSPKRRYVCPACERRYLLHPGMYWHNCGGYQFRLDDERMTEAVKVAVRGLVDLFRETTAASR